MKQITLLPSVLAELNLGDRCLDGVLSNNNYESDVLKVQARRGQREAFQDPPVTS